MLSVKDNLVVNINSEDLDINDIVNHFNSKVINYVNLGRQSYMSAWKLQKQFHQLIKNDDIPSTVLFLEHENVYTLGKNANKNYLLNTFPDIDVVDTDRGGEITYHGPGQLVGYPIINLNNYNKSITWFINSLEQIIINTLKEFSINGSRKDNLPGVWVDDEKICAMGVRIAQWVTMHGFALNVNPNMKYFDGMIPCGILDYGVTSMTNSINNSIKLEDIMSVLSFEFNIIFDK
jgi:lipoyl(octanoyl) transferase